MIIPNSEPHPSREKLKKEKKKYVLKYGKQGNLTTYLFDYAKEYISKTQ